MASRNVLKVDIEESYYHLYARGASRQRIFIDQWDFNYFLQLFGRYLSHQEVKSPSRVPYKKLHGDLELLCYCLMRNHFHLLIYQIHCGAMERLMRGVMTAYSRYFNQKYKRTGPLFETRYKAALITNESYLEHITRYIHLNPKLWRTYPYSSLPTYLGGVQHDWITPARITELFASPHDYEGFVIDYESTKRMLNDIKSQLADG